MRLAIVNSTILGLQLLRFLLRPGSLSSEEFFSGGCLLRFKHFKVIEGGKL